MQQHTMEHPEPKLDEPRTEQSISKQGDTIKDFLDVVFADVVPNGAHIATFALNVEKKNPSFIAQTPPTLIKNMGRSKNVNAYYYCTATHYPTVNAKTGENEIRRTRETFAALHAVVLDDIGTKVNIDDIPEALRKPTYIIESSQGNYQYGYVLEEPITDHTAASALITAVYASGFTDTGGAMVNKPVRLPAGVNGKNQDDKKNFPVALLHLDESMLWTPQELLDAANVEERWSDISEDPDSYYAKKSKLPRKSAQWEAHKHSAIQGNTSPDAALNYLYEIGAVRNDNGGDFIEVVCPWADKHSDPTQDTAGYSPLGRGANTHTRGFHCFHDSCSGQKTPQFLEEVEAGTGLKLPVYDPTGEVVKDWAFDTVNSCFRNLHSKAHPSIPASNFTWKYPLFDAELKRNKTSLVNMVKMNPALIQVEGITYDARTSDIITTSEDGGCLHYNTAIRADWPKVDQIDQELIKPILDHIHYLIPDQTTRDFFMQSLAAKAQDIMFRGCGVIMVADKVQGIGRSTLMRSVLTPLFGGDVTGTVPFSAISTAQNYNTWEQLSYVFVDEAKTFLTNGRTGRAAGEAAYEILKENVDTSVTHKTINPKFDKQYKVKVHSSFLIATNHADAITVPKGDRRFLIVNNPTVARSKEYYAELYKALDVNNPKPEWCKHFWQYLQDFIVDPSTLNYPPITQAKIKMEQTSGTPLDDMLDTVFGNLETSFVSRKIINSILSDPSLELYKECGFSTHEHYERALRLAILRATSGVSKTPRVLLKGSKYIEEGQHRVYVIDSHERLLKLQGNDNFEALPFAVDAATFNEAMNKPKPEGKLKQALKKGMELSAEEKTINSILESVKNAFD